MGHNFDPADIADFLRGHHASAHAHGRPAYNTYSYSGAHDDEQPRWAPSMKAAHAVDLLDIDDDGEAYFDDDAHTEYAVMSAVTSHPCTVRSTVPSSIFSHPEEDDDSDLRSISASTAPSRTGPYLGPTFEEQFFGAGAANPHHLGLAPATQAHAHSHAHTNQTLWCEFADLLNCPATFHLNAEAAWIEHHAAHLGDTFPRRLMCWFCDPDRRRHNHHHHHHHHDNNNNNNAPRPRFEAAGPRHRDARANFVARMRHVREHILAGDGGPGGGPWASSGDMRPDFHVVSHLWEKGVLSREAYEHAMAYDELPERYRLPGWQEQEQADASAHRSLDAGTTSREKGQFHDLEKERRAERRRVKERLLKGGGGGGGGGGKQRR